MPWNAQINRVLELAFEGGFYQFFLKKYIRSEVLKPHIEKLPPSIFKIKHVQGPFYILLIGLALSLICFGFEVQV